MLTTPGGPVVVGQRTLHAMLAIRREKILVSQHQQILISQSNFNHLHDVLPQPPDWLTVQPDQPTIELPSRVAGFDPLDRATLQLALAHQASLVLIDGPAKESAKLSFFKCEGALSMLVWAHRQGELTAVQPMVKAWKALGFEDVLPPPEALKALWTALDQLEDE